MRAPLGWLREYVRFEAPVPEIVRRLAICSLEVDRVIDVGLPDVEGNLDHFVVGRVVSAERHPNADRLQLCQVDIGAADPEQIVCGAWNFGAGATVAVALPGATVLDRDGAPFELGEATLRGQVSRGMILAEDEVGLGTDHTGIMVLPDDLEPGTPLHDVLPLREQVLEVTPTRNRVDLLSMVGLARDVAAIFDGELIPIDVDDPPIVHPEWVDVAIDDPIGCPRYIARVLRGVEVGPSPVWLRSRLHAAGMRSISNVVDVTNYVMHVYGSPLHAFDRAKLTDGRILVRRGRDGEQVRTLDGVTRMVDARDLLITDGTRAVALAAIMGGEETEVTDKTTEVMLEAANFEPIGILRTSERLGLRTDGSNRWEKGVDPHLAEPAAILATRLLVDLAGAELTGAIDVHEGLPERPVVHLRPARTNAILGLNVPDDEQRALLEALGFEVDDAWEVTVPTWRARDVTREIDLVEEVGRLVLERVPRTMPVRSAVEGHLTRAQKLRRLLEDTLVGAGLSEAYTLTLVARDPRPDAVVVPAPDGAEQLLLRTTLIDGLVEAARLNRDAGNHPVRLFELARVYLPTGGQLPDEPWRVAGIVEGGFDEARAVVEVVHRTLHLDLEARREAHPALHPGKSASVPAGWFGELHPATLEGAWGVFELDVATLTETLPERILYRDVITYPALRQDIAIVVDESVEAAAVVEVVREAAGEVLRDAEVFDVYRDERLGSGRKSVAVHLAFQAADRTLSDDDVVGPREMIVAALADRLGAELRA